MKFTDEQIREVLELQQKISEKIRHHREEIELLEKNLSVLNSIIKQSSFTKASMLEPEKQESVIPITKSGDGSLIANAYVTQDQVSIVLEENVGLYEETPPFKSFFVDRIIGEMKRKDNTDADNGLIERESVIDCVINKNGTTLHEIVIKNYRQKERVNEIINTASWSLSKMIDNSSK